LCRDFAANGPHLQGVSAEDSSKDESLGADALQLVGRSHTLSVATAQNSLTVDSAKIWQFLTVDLKA
jgi:hypothetical protein